MDNPTATPQDFRQLFAQNPLAKAQLDAIVWKRIAEELQTEVEQLNKGPAEKTDKK